MYKSSGFVYHRFFIICSLLLIAFQVESTGQVNRYYQSSPSRYRPIYNGNSFNNATRSLMEVQKQRLACQERNMKYTSALWNWLTELQGRNNNIEYQNRLNQFKNSVNSASKHVEVCSTFEWLERIENDVRQYLNDFALTKGVNLWTEALRLHKLGDFRGAIKLYDQLIEFNPDFWQAYMNRGIAKYAIMNYDEACSDWKKVISLGKSNEGYAMWIDYCN